MITTAPEILAGVFMLTARHTGTRWLRRNIHNHGYRFDHDGQYHVEDDHLWQAPLYESGRFSRVLLTMRHPVRRALSHINNFSAVAWGVYGQLRQVVAEYPDSFVFRVDCPQDGRAERVTRLEAWLGIELPHFDWDHSDFHRPDLWPCIREHYEQTGRLIANPRAKRTDRYLLDPTTAQWLRDEFGYDDAWMRRQCDN